MPTPLKMAGLFAGIGGIELGFQRALGDGVETTLLCEWWEPAKTVLATHFPEVELHPDVRLLDSLPAGLDVLAAGFPCTDLSQAGRTAGIAGAQSGLVAHVFHVLRVAASADRRLPWLLIENVPNMLALDRGRAMAYLIEELESLGYRWAYRVVDSRFTGVPQRRRRVLLLASPTEDHRPVLFAEDAGGLDEEHLDDTIFGFYWTEGRGGLGWAQDAVPTLKGGSTIGIPSPPAIWVSDNPLDRTFITPAVADAEQLQGFPRGWTDVVDRMPRGHGHRWKLVGNAVTTRVAEWVAGQLRDPGEAVLDDQLWTGSGTWPTAAWGENGKIWRVAASEFPRRAPHVGLRSVVDVATAPPLIDRAINGFRSRLEQGNLGRHPGFRDAVSAYADSARLPGLDTLGRRRPHGRRAVQ